MPSQNIMRSLYLAVCQSVHHARRLAPCATLPMALASVEPGRNIATQGNVARPAGGAPWRPPHRLPADAWTH
jgi:hypothetical protein